MTPAAAAAASHEIANKDTMQTAERMARLGTESAFEVLARANALAAQGRDIINLGIGQPDFPLRSRCYWPARSSQRLFTSMNRELKDERRYAARRVSHRYGTADRSAPGPAPS